MTNKLQALVDEWRKYGDENSVCATELEAVLAEMCDVALGLCVQDVSGNCGIHNRVERDPDDDEFIEVYSGKLSKAASDAKNPTKTINETTEAQPDTQTLCKDDSSL